MNANQRVKNLIQATKDAWTAIQLSDPSKWCAQCSDGAVTCTVARNGAGPGTYTTFDLNGKFSSKAKVLAHFSEVCNG